MKVYIGFSVAYNIYPSDDGINIDQDISANAGANGDGLATDINTDAFEIATHYKYKWTNVAPSVVAKLKTVGDLVKLVIANLAKAGS